jgi:hypothetical protein
LSALVTFSLPAVEQPVDVASLRLRERDESEEPARLGRIIARDCRLEVLAEWRRLTELPP